MTAVVIPFPVTRRRDFIRRSAARLAETAPNTAEKLLAHTITIQIETMARRGIAPDLITQQATPFRALAPRRPSGRRCRMTKGLHPNGKNKHDGQWVRLPFYLLD